MGTHPAPIRLVRSGGRWLIDSGGSGGFLTPYASCVIRLGEAIRTGVYERNVDEFTDATKREYIDRLCARLAKVGLTWGEDDDTDDALAGDLINDMYDERRIRLRG